MVKNISILTVLNNGKPALKISVQKALANNAILSLVALDGTILRLVALPEGESIISLEKIQEPDIHIKIETSYQTLLRRINVATPGQEMQL